MVAVSPRAEQIFVLPILNFSSLSRAKTGGFGGCTSKLGGLSECGARVVSVQPKHLKLVMSSLPPPGSAA